MEEVIVAAVVVGLAAGIAIGAIVAIIAGTELLIQWRMQNGTRKPSYDRSRIARVIAFAADEMKVDLPTGLAQHAASLVHEELCKPGSVIVEETHS